MAAGSAPRNSPPSWSTPSRYAASEIAGHYDQREYGKALRKIMQLADLANQYVDAKKPWDIAKSPDRARELHTVCSTALALFRDLTLYLKPVLPRLAAGVEAMLGIPELTWEHAWQHLPAGHAIKPYKHLLTRIDAKQIVALVEANKETLVATPASAGAPSRAPANSPRPLPRSRRAKGKMRVPARR